ncbi:MAG: phosphoribosylglycinamide formyltransferase [Alphaproteobacteria bacterium]|nr:phosphoribosylglycinamide formyltransferase [Alphaproteobacteria bacterium]
MARLKLAVLISGTGTNLQALIDACREPDFPAEIALVISSRPGVPGLERAGGAGLATAVIDHKAFKDRAAFDAALDRRLRDSGAGLVCLAGFMRLLTEGFAQSWRDRLVNIHPSLLPAFQGRHAHERALSAGVRFTGCTVHFVRPEMDQGPIIVQAAVPVHVDDTVETLRERVLSAEHRCYPLAVKLIAEGRVRVVNEIALIAGADTPRAAILNPRDSRGR